MVLLQEFEHMLRSYANHKWTQESVQFNNHQILTIGLSCCCSFHRQRGENFEKYNIVIDDKKWNLVCLLKGRRLSQELQDIFVYFAILVKIEL